MSNSITKLEEVKIYTNGRNRYSLSQKNGFPIEVAHNELKRWAALYALSNDKTKNLFLHAAELFGDNEIYELYTKKEEDGSFIVLVINNDCDDGGVKDYQDWREYVPV